MGILRKVEVVETDGANSQNPRYLLQTSQASQTDAIIIHLTSVSDPLHFDANPDPRIRIRDNGSDLKSS